MSAVYKIQYLSSARRDLKGVFEYINKKRLDY